MKLKMMNKMKMKNKNKNKNFGAKSFFSVLFLFIALLCLFSAQWYVSVFGNTGFDSILYTLFSDLGGVESGMVFDYLTVALLPCIIISAAYALVLTLKVKRSLILHIGKKIKLKLLPISKAKTRIVSLFLSIIFIVSAALKVDMVIYLINSLSISSTFIEENYVDPKATNITFPEEKRNLIVIYLESMETSFTSAEYGGGNDVNPLTELCNLAEANINFSQNDTVGGFSALTGGTWTIGALVSLTAGIPFKLPNGIDKNSYGETSFLPGVTTLSDVLHQNGYYQALMVGSIASFGGRDVFYQTHGTDTIYDLLTARSSGLVHPDYYEWWGIEDFRLYYYAKQELTKIAAQDQPFAFSMLTVDTHHVGGYVCELCNNEYTEQYENVLSCASRQLYSFIEWLKQQDFYKNTTIVVCGDHPTMDARYFSTNIGFDYNRKVYNCFINSAINTKNSKNRDFCSYDIFPTTLAAMGCTIEGDQLGLGVNLFSDKSTLCEKFSVSKLNSKLSQKSEFYENNFY